MHHHIIPLKVYLGVYLILIFLTIATVAVSFFPVNALLHLIGAIAIAAVKTVLILLIFMHVKYGDNLVKTYAFIGFFFVIIFMIIMMGDYISLIDGLSPSTNAVPFDIF